MKRWLSYLLIGLGAVFFAACSQDSGKDGVKQLDPQQKLQAKDAIRSLHQLENGLAHAAGKITPPEDLAKYVSLLGACEVIEASEETKDGFWATTEFSGDACPVRYHLRHDFKGKFTDDEIVLEGIKSKVRYETVDSEILSLIDLKSYSAELKLGDVSIMGSQGELFSKSVNFVSLSAGTVSGKDAANFRLLPKDILELGLVRDLKFPTSRLVVKAIGQYQLVEDQEPIDLGTKYYLNGQEISAEEFEQYFPGGEDQLRSQSKVLTQ